jgi:ribosomal protein S18 acetylase RimI-like enzyme
MGAVAMFLEVAAGNFPARGLYEAAGFAKAGVRPGYYADGGDAVVLRLGLA